MLLEAARRNVAGWPTDRRDEMVDAIGRDQGEHPRERRAPVVADDVGALGAGVAQHRQHVADQQVHPVRLDGSGLSERAVAAQVRNDHPEAGVGQRRDLVAPQPSRIGKAVQQHHRPALAGHVVFDPDPVDVNAHGRSR